MFRHIHTEAIAAAIHDVRNHYEFHEQDDYAHGAQAALDMLSRELARRFSHNDRKFNAAAFLKMTED